MTLKSLYFKTAEAPRRLRVMIAATPFKRMRGLLARRPLSRGEAMLIRPCNMIHTVGMGYKIDVVFLARDGVVLRVADAVAPLRMRMHFGAHSVLELAAGEAARLGIESGARLPVARL